MLLVQTEPGPALGERERERETRNFKNLNETVKRAEWI
jgi:hypothetical protein